MQKWKLDDIEWSAFDPTKVEPELLKVVKAASLVEYNGDLYGEYLARVFADDPVFVDAARQWAREEVLHGIALADWACLADPGWDPEDARQRYRNEYQQVDLDAMESVRGSRYGELVSRCMVEIGTSSHYSALGDATDEPVLKQICKFIAADEFRHYRLFYDHMRRYRENENPHFLRRFAVAAGRFAETEDDELSFAFHIANNMDGPYDRKSCAVEYGSRIWPLYRKQHIRLAVNMILKTIGLKPGGWLGQRLSWIITRLFDYHRKRKLRLAFST